VNRALANSRIPQRNALPPLFSLEPSGNIHGNCFFRSAPSFSKREDTMSALHCPPNPQFLTRLCQLSLLQRPQLFVYLSRNNTQELQPGPLFLIRPKPASVHREGAKSLTTRPKSPSVDCRTPSPSRSFRTFVSMNCKAGSPVTCSGANSLRTVPE